MNNVQTRMNRMIPNDLPTGDLAIPEKIQFKIFNNNEKIYRSLAE
jgi:hypothetical protein